MSGFDSVFVRQSTKLSQLPPPMSYIGLGVIGIGLILFGMVGTGDRLPRLGSSAQ